MNTSTPLHSPTKQEIAEKLALLNTHAWKPAEPLPIEEIRQRVRTADECFQWFLGHSIPLERVSGKREYRIWTPQPVNA